MVTLNYTVPADIVALDAEENPVLLVKIAVSVYQEGFAEQELVGALNAALAPIPYAMIVDRHRIQVFRWDGGALTLLCTLPTEQVLNAYNEDYPSEDISFYQLQGLTMIWLRDVAFRWKYPDPPGAKELHEAGVSGRLTNGNIVSGT